MEKKTRIVPSASPNILGEIEEFMGTDWEGQQKNNIFYLKYRKERNLIMAGRKWRKKRL
jgi:hypothetical protein